MKKLLLLVLLFPMSSWALFTARANYTGIVAKDALTEVCKGKSCEGQTPGMVPLYGLGADVIVSLPLVPVGFGLRTEKLKLEVSKDGIEGEALLNRTAVLANYRLINTIVHLGSIISYGIDHSAGVRVAQGGSNVVDYSGGTLTSYTVGMELEVKPLIVLPLIVGAEAGLIQTKWKDATDSVSGSKKDIDLSGNYIKFFLGLDI